MGFRSNFIAHGLNDIPQWFIDKYKDMINFHNNGFPISSKFERKCYDGWAELPEDLQKILKDTDGEFDINLIYLHECGGITKVQIYKERIIYAEPEEWKITDEVEHMYCYGCTDLREIKQNEWINISKNSSNGDELLKQEKYAKYR